MNALILTTEWRLERGERSLSASDTGRLNSRGYSASGLGET
jgi:hypothetical protein